MCGGGWGVLGLCVSGREEAVSMALLNGLGGFCIFFNCLLFLIMRVYCALKVVDLDGSWNGNEFFSIDRKISMLN